MINAEVEINDNYICVYERLNDDCIRLLHMYGKNPVCVVPAMLQELLAFGDDLVAVIFAEKANVRFGKRYLQKPCQPQVGVLLTHQTAQI